MILLNTQSIGMLNLHNILVGSDMFGVKSKGLIKSHLGLENKSKKGF